MSKCQILIVEDENIAALALRRALETLGYGVLDAVVSGEEAIRRVAETRPDLVLMDIKLRGEMDGLEAAGHIKSEFGTPVIYLTAYADEATLQRAKVTQPFGYISKPFDEKALQIAIEIALSRREIKQRLKDSEEKYRNIVELAPDGIVTADLKGMVTACNSAFLVLSGYSRDEIVGKHISQLPTLQVKDLPKYLEIFQAMLRGEVSRPVEFKWKRNDGTIRWGEARASLMKWNSRAAGVQVIVRDITERKRQEQLMRALNQAAVSMATALSPDEIFAAVGAEFKKLNFNCVIATVDESNAHLITEYVNYESSLLKAAQKLMGIGWKHFSIPIDKVSVCKKIVRDRQPTFVRNHDEIIRDIMPGPVQPFTSRLVKMFKLGRAVAAPLVAEDQVMGVLSVQSDDLTGEDIPAISAFAYQVAATWRKAQLYEQAQHEIRERERLSVQLLQSQKMEAVGLLAGGIAHDFNNLLTAINGFAELVQLQLSPGDPAYEMVGNIREAGGRASDLVGQLLAFSSKQIIKPQVLDLNRTVAEMDKMLRRIIGEHIQMRVVLETSLWSIKADPRQLEQVIVNLVVNARDAMPGGGKLVIETHNVLLDDAYVDEHLEANPGAYVQLAVSDTGTGMSEEVKARIFEPFFTTKEMGRGTGLGLATVYGILRHNDGHIQVYSEEGRGTVFKLYFPRVVEAVDVCEEGKPEDVLLPGVETILLVEDELSVRDLARLTLTKQGYNVLVAADGQDALCVARQHPGKIDLLLTDVVMPHMNGQELAKQLQAQQPDLRVLYMSGYAEQSASQHGLWIREECFISKPFALRSLIQKVRSTLDNDSFTNR